MFDMRAGLLAWCAGEEADDHEGAGLSVLALLERIAAEHPGPDVIAALAGFDPEELGGDERAVWLAAWERQMCWMSARQQTGITAVAAATPAGDDDWGREEVAAALRLSPGAAQLRLDVARQLGGRLAATAAALAAGRISFPHARALADGVADLDNAAAQVVEAGVLPQAEMETPGRFRGTVARAVMAADPHRTELAHAQEAAYRRVEVFPDDHGMATLWARLTAPDAQLVWRAVDSLAQRDGTGDGRGVDARRADALVTIAAAALADPRAERARRPAACVHVTVGLTTLLGLVDAPGELTGHGPIPASLARSLAADGEWRRLVTDPVDGQVLDCGRTTYRAPAPLVDFLRARDRTCRFPGCPRPAERCDIDHNRPWGDGGHTDPVNCRHLCRRHHRLKTFGEWTIEAEPNGDVTWISPNRRRYFVPITGYPPDE